MSNIGKLPVEVKQGTQIKIENEQVVTTGPKGTLSFKLPPGVAIEVNDSIATVKRVKKNKELHKFYGLARALLANTVKGVNDGFEKQLELVGVGYRAKLEGKTLVLNLGFAKPVKITPPEDIAIQVKDNIVTVSGIDNVSVGDVAAKIRRVRPPEPYKGKGIKYVGEHIRRKAGKAAKGAGE